MSTHISSSQPRLLYRYSDVAQRLDHELIGESGRLGNVLRHFEATCREGGMAPRVSHLADALRGYAQGAEPVDRWVGAVGKGFEQADRRSIVRVIADWLRGLLQLRPGMRSETTASPEAPYAGITVMPRGVGPFAVQAQRIYQRFPGFIPYLTPRSLLSAFLHTRWALTKIIQSIYDLVFRFHWFRWRILPWLQDWLSGFIPFWPKKPAEDGESDDEGIESRPAAGLEDSSDSDAQGTIPGALDPSGSADTTEEADNEDSVVSPTDSPDEHWTEDQIRNYVEDNQGRLPTVGEECVIWARERVATISDQDVPFISTYNSDNHGAYNLIYIYGDSAVQLDEENVSTTLADTEPGALLVWNSSNPETDAGHVAVVERVETEGVWISQANWPINATEESELVVVRFYTHADLVAAGVYLVPSDAEPVSQEDYARYYGERDERDERV